MDLTAEQLQELFKTVRERDMKRLEEQNLQLKELLVKTQEALKHRPAKNATRQVPPQGCGGEPT